jgi:hypothetical protein
MAVNALNLRETVSVSGSIADTVTGANQPAAYGSGPLPQVSTVWVFGTGANTQAPAQIYSDQWYMAARSVAATTADNLTFNNSVLNFEGGYVNFANIKRLDIILNTPAATNVSFFVGPQGVSNAAQLWFQAKTTDFYDTVIWWLRQVNPWGWTITTSTADVLGILNESTTTQVYTVWALGD